VIAQGESVQPLPWRASHFQNENMRNTTKAAKATTTTRTKTDTASKPTGRQEITITERIAQDGSSGGPAVVHFGTSRDGLARITRLAEARGMTAEQYLSAMLFNRIAADFVESVAGKLPPTTPSKVQAYADTNGLPPERTEQDTTGRRSLALSFTPEHHAAIEKAADASGMTVADWSNYQLRSAARNAPDIHPEADTYQLDIPRQTFRHLTATAVQQGFRNLPEMILHVVTAYAWPAERVSVLGHWPDFNRWNQAARARGETLLDSWILRSLNEAAELDLASRPDTEPNNYGATARTARR
jgi:hypothetical protein